MYWLNHILKKRHLKTKICVEVKFKKIPRELSDAYHIARYSYLSARRVFGNYNRNFYIYCSYESTIKQQDEDEIRQFKGTTTKYTKKT